MIERLTVASAAEQDGSTLVDAGDVERQSDGLEIARSVLDVERRLDLRAKRSLLGVGSGVVERGTIGNLFRGAIGVLLYEAESLVALLSLSHTGEAQQ